MRKRTSISPNDLDRLKRSELQALCRKHNIKGLTRKNAELISDLRTAFLEKHKDEISDVELSDSEYPVSGAEDSEDKDKSDLLDELTFAPSAFTKKILSNISYAKEVPTTRVKPESQYAGKSKKASSYTKMVESDEESDVEVIRNPRKTEISKDTDMNDSFVFTFNNSTAKVSSKSSIIAVDENDKKSITANGFTKSAKSIVKSGEPSYSKAKEPSKLPDSYSTDAKNKTYVSQEPIEKLSSATTDQTTILPKHKPSRPKRLVRHTVAAKPFEIKVPKTTENDKPRPDLKTESNEDMVSRHTTTSMKKREELEVKPDSKPIAPQKRRREHESSKESDVNVSEVKVKELSSGNSSQVSKSSSKITQDLGNTAPFTKEVSPMTKPQSPKSTFYDPFAGESVSEWLERIDLPSAIRTFERESMMDWKLVQLLTFEYLGVMGFTVGDALKLLLALKDKFPKEVLIQSNPLSHSQISLIQQIVDEKIQAALDSYSQSAVKSKVISSGPGLPSKPVGALQQPLTQLQTNAQHQAQPQTRPKVSTTIASALSSNISAGLSSNSSPLDLSITVNADDRRDSIPKGNTIQKRTLWEKSINQPKESALPSKLSKPTLSKSTATRQPIGKRVIGNRTIRANSVDLPTIESPAKKRRLDTKPSEAPVQASNALSTWHDEAVIDPLASSGQPRSLPTGDNPFQTKFTLPRTPPKSTPSEENGNEEPQAPGTGGRKRWADIPPLDTNWQPKYVP